MTPTDKQAAVEAALAKWDNRVIELIDINGRQWTRSDRVFDLIDEIRALLAEPRPIFVDDQNDALANWKQRALVAEAALAESRPEGVALPRYGIKWVGPTEPIAVPMDDGYWTPWHLAAAPSPTPATGEAADRCDACNGTLDDHYAPDGGGCPSFRKDVPVQVQACRPEDRAMLATPAGQELLRCAIKAMRELQSDPTPPTRPAQPTPAETLKVGHEGHASMSPDALRNSPKFQADLERVAQLRERLQPTPAPTGDEAAVAKVRVARTGGNAGIHWHATAVNDYESLPVLKDGTLLYTRPNASAEPRGLPERAVSGDAPEDIRFSAPAYAWADGWNACLDAITHADEGMKG